MSDVLLLKISPPMQAWGIDSLFAEERKTNRFPTKSGVVGMIASSLGWSRDHDLSRLNHLKMGVRIDSPGVLENDFQIVRKPSQNTGKLSHRWYLTDAVFLVALQSDDSQWLETIMNALRRPYYNVFAGRKAFPLNPDFIQGIIRDVTIDSVLHDVAWSGYGEQPKKVELIRDAMESDTDVFTINDVPVSFEHDNRSWVPRSVVRAWIPLHSDDETKGSASNDVPDFDGIDFAKAMEEV